MPSKSQPIPWFPFLLPLFFVFHSFVENSHYLRFKECLPLIGIYLLGAFLVFGLFRLFLKNNVAAALMAGFILAFYFFFGAIHDLLHDHLPFLGKYVVLLPLFVILSIILFIRLRRRQPSGRIIVWLNSLLLIYLLFDGVTLWLQKDRPLRNKPSLAAMPAFQYCDSCPAPDIYLLLFDEYSGSNTLRNVYRYDNGSLDSFLVKEGFHIQHNSRSNYNMTPFSMASIFNAAYLDLRDPEKLVNNDYLDMIAADRPVAALDFLERQGYDIVNHSPFDLPGHPATEEQTYFPSGVKLITRSTLPACVMRDIGWLWYKKGLLPWISPPQKIYVERNRHTLAAAIEDSRRKSPRPRFIYTHLFMPHPPLLYDSLQRPRTWEALGGDTGTTELRAYLNYIPYTNARAKELISAIKKNTAGKAVIIFMSDHGYRYAPFEESSYRFFFDNQNAIYYPDGDYRLFYDSISAVNEFRVVFSKLFNQHVGLLKDSTIYLRDQKPPLNKK